MVCRLWWWHHSVLRSVWGLGSRGSAESRATIRILDVPRASKTPQLRNTPRTALGILLWFKVHDLIKGVWEALGVVSTWSFRKDVFAVLLLLQAQVVFHTSATRRDPINICRSINDHAGWILRVLWRRVEEDCKGMLLPIIPTPASNSWRSS